MKLPTFLFFLFALSACGNDITIDKCNEDSIKSWVQNVKSKELSLFRNLVIEPRYRNNIKNPRYTGIEIIVKNEESIILPVLENGSNITSRGRFGTYIDRFAKMNRVSPDSALNFASLYVNNVMKQFYELDVYAVDGYPDLGELIIFTISPGCEVVYCPDTTKVHHAYWQDFFRKTQEIDKGWYRKLN